MLSKPLPQPIDLVATSTEIKSSQGVFKITAKETEDGVKYELKLQIKDLSQPVAEEIMRVVTPFFENPESPQLNLFVEDNNV